LEAAAPQLVQDFPPDDKPPDDERGDDTGGGEGELLWFSNSRRESVRRLKALVWLFPPTLTLCLFESAATGLLTTGEGVDCEIGGDDDEARTAPGITLRTKNRSPASSLCAIAASR